MIHYYCGLLLTFSMFFFHSIFVAVLPHFYCWCVTLDRAIFVVSLGKPLRLTPNTDLYMVLTSTWPWPLLIFSSPPLLALTVWAGHSRGSIYPLWYVCKHFFLILVIFTFTAISIWLLFYEMRELIWSVWNIHLKCILFLLQ